MGNLPVGVGSNCNMQHEAKTGGTKDETEIFVQKVINSDNSHFETILVNCSII